MKEITAVFLKQINETLKNKTVLIQFLMFPILTLIMENTIRIDGMPEHFFAKLFAVMFVGMAPLTCMASIISEEKEKNTLRVLVMSNVKPFQYLLGISLYVWLMCMIGAIIFALCSGLYAVDFLIFVVFLALGIIVSEIIGAIIGVICHNQMSATSVTVPVMIVLSFLPMLSVFNSTIKSIAKYTYSQQISLLVNEISNRQNYLEGIIVVLVNLTIFIAVFVFAFRKKGLDT